MPPHHENYTSQTNQTRGTLLEKQGRAHKRCTPVDPHIWMCKSRTTSTNLYTATMWGHQDVTLKTCRGRWVIGRNGERGSGISALAARHDDDDDDDFTNPMFLSTYCLSIVYTFFLRIYLYFLSYRGLSFISFYKHSQTRTQQCIYILYIYTYATMQKI